MNTQPEAFQIPIEAAEIYEERFVPALFAEWAPRLVRAAGVAACQSVLDVACGTGIVARTAAELVGPTGSVVGVDLNESMLTVAARVSPPLELRRGDVAALPCEDGAFDVALCQMALMFFPDRAGAIREMARVVRPGGVVGICVPAELADQPAYAPFVEMVVGRAGPDARSLLNTYWSCGDLDYLTGLFADAGLRVTDRRTEASTARYPSVEGFVATEVESTPLVERLTSAEYDAIKEDAREVLAPYTKADEVGVPLVGHLLIGTPAG